MKDGVTHGGSSPSWRHLVEDLVEAITRLDLSLITTETKLLDVGDDMQVSLGATIELDGK